MKKKAVLGRYGALTLAACCFMLSLAACGSESAGLSMTAAPTTEPTHTSTIPLTPTEQGITIAPITEPDPTEPPEPGEMSQQTQIVRYTGASGVFQGLLGTYATGQQNLGLAHAASQEELDALLDAADSEQLRAAASYGADFWQVYDLAVILRETNTGSIEQTVQIDASADGALTITISSKVPEYTTMDMADWFILVPLEKELTSERNVAVRLAAAFGSSQNDSPFWDSGITTPSGESVLPTEPMVKR